MKKRITFTLDEKIIKELKETSERTMIPQARIVEQAIIDFLKKLESKM
ncbi:ribbon-helix-helix domain-containing protein [Anoxybacillus kestanbolensis]